ncbi:MAG TPA: phosphotransferase [Gammaproteobacteria bacterium]|nr:phosphotransferase [Gammaproteobacteria bacterium]
MDDRFERLRMHYERERAAGLVPRTREHIPLGYDMITPEWLTAVLSPAHPGIAVRGLRLGEIDEGTSSRRRIQLQYADAARARAAGWPATVFCKGSPALANRYILGMNNGIAAETNFYNHVRPTLPIEAPVAYHARYDPDSFNSIIVMRDLRERVEFCRIDTPMDLARGRSQMDLLARLHGEYYASPAKFVALRGFNDWEKYFDATVELAGFGPACARGFLAAEAVIPARLYARRDEVWPATLASVAEHATLPRTLIHSDVHLKNWYVAAGEVMGLNDWQCSCKGNGARDLAYAISTAFEPAARRRYEQDLIRYYLDRLRACGATPPSFDEAFRLYRRNLFNALAWWTGTLGQPPEAPKMQPPEASLEFIRRMSTAIDDLDALDSF